MVQGVKRTATVYTTLPVGELLFLTMTGHEKLGRPYKFELSLLSENPNIELSAMLGQAISVTLELPDRSYRQFNGIVSHFWIAGELGRYVRYRATVRPRLWLLSQRVGSRIFQGKTVPAVIDKVFEDAGLTDVTRIPPLDYRSFEYLVQYRESDLDFVCRIMEMEGIYFYFKHEQHRDFLVLADSQVSHDRAPGYETIPFYPPQSSQRRERDHLDHWTARRTIRPGVFSARDFNFTRPGAPIMPNPPAMLEHGRKELEVHAYPGKFQDTGEAGVQSRIRLEELQADVELGYAEGNVRGLSSGRLFELTRFPRDDQNKEYLITEAHYDMKVGDYESKDGDDKFDYRTKVVAMDSARPFRPPRLTKKPVVEGPQTAIVVGKKDEDLWTDEYGRVRVQFHWDREGKANESTACFVRVSQLWAGSGFGGMHIPRIGQEVIVDFIDGDPDRPVITGRLYNASHMPPYELPLNQTQSGIKSRSSKGGMPSNFNEIRFEDKKGKEELHLQAEKDMTTLVKNNQSTTVQANRSASVTGSDSVSVGGDRSMSVSGSRSATITKKETQTFKDAREMTVATTNSDTITGAHTGTYQAGRTLTVSGGDDNLTTSGGNKNVTVNGHYTLTATSHFQAKHGSDEVFLKGALAKITNGKCTVSLDGGNATIEAPDKIEIKCGGSSVTLTPSGIEVKGTKVSLDGGGSRVELAQAGATVSGSKCSVAASGVTEVTGMLVKIN